MVLSGISVITVKPGYSELTSTTNKYPFYPNFAISLSEWKKGENNIANLDTWKALKSAYIGKW